MMRDASTVLLIGLLCAVSPGLAAAQGVGDATLGGRVSNDAGQPIAGALVLLTNGDVGSIRTERTDERGSFQFASVPVGSRYVLEARAIGYAPMSITAITLHAGDRPVRELVLSAQARRLDDIIVRGAALRDAGAGGPVNAIPTEAVRNVPLLNRNVVGLFGMSSLATGGTDLSISGQHARFNSIQVDGGSAGDLFGVNLTPGAGAGTKSLSLEAVDEVRILVAPFDVRQGGFSGGVINAITRSGTNDLHASSFLSLGRSDLVGKDTALVPAEHFEMLQYGFSAGGPIVRDRIHFFVAADAQWKQTPFAGWSASDPATGISDSTARRAAQVFRDKYGFQAGGPEAPVLQLPNRNLFAKLSWQVGEAHLLTLSSTWADATTDQFNRSVRDKQNRDGWMLSNSGAELRNVTSLSRLKVTSVWSHFANELNASVQVIHDASDSRNRVPLFLVRADDPKYYLAGGSTITAQDTYTNQRVIELTDNITTNVAAHEITVGGQAQSMRVGDRLFNSSWGTWTFGSVDALERMEPLRYELARAIRPGGPAVDYTFTMLAAYAQDRWRITPRLIVTAGIRADVPFSDAPPRNDSLAANTALGNIDTGVFPSGNAVISPRIGFSYLVGQRGDLMLRGGIGGFAGRPPAAWLKNAFANTGQEQSLLTCGINDGVPAPTTDINNLPTHCLVSSSQGVDVSTIAFFSPHYRFQQARKFVLGVDRDFGSGASASLDIVHTRTDNTTLVHDANLVEKGLNAEGRMMYGSINGQGTATPSRVDSHYGPAYQFDNISADRSMSVAAVFNKQWEGGAALQASYDWSRSTDVMSMTGFTGQILLNNNPIDGTQLNRHQARSARDVPHTFVITAVLPATLGLTSSFFLRARSGTPYAYVAGGDANADGTGSNDLMYVPRSAADISLVKPGSYEALDAYIEHTPCLREQRGRIMSRNSCRNPSVTQLDARLARPLRLGGGRTMEITADVFNLPNLLRRDWGIVRETTSKETLPFLAVSGWDSDANRARYALPAILPEQSPVLPDASRWTMQLGARYHF